MILSLVSFSCVFAGMIFGFAIAVRFPGEHLNGDSKDAVKAAWGILATMTALVLGLLLSEAKSSYDTLNGEIIQSGAKIVILDQTLDDYGPETKAARLQLRDCVAERLQKLSPDTNGTVSADVALETGRGMRPLQEKLRQLTPVTDDQRALLTQAKQFTTDLGLNRWLIINQARNPLPTLFIFILVFWLTTLFIGLSLFAPLNRTVFITLLICNLSISGAIYLITDLSCPLSGLVRVSSAPLVEAQDYLNREQVQ